MLLNRLFWGVVLVGVVLLKPSWRLYPFHQHKRNLQKWLEAPVGWLGDCYGRIMFFACLCYCVSKVGVCQKMAKHVKPGS